MKSAWSEHSAPIGLGLALLVLSLVQLSGLPLPPSGT